MTHPLQPLNSTQAFISMQSLHLNSRGMNRKTGIMSTDFESVEKSQTYCQKEERFTVQNKLTDASPYQGTNPKSKAFHSTQILICQVERSAVQNKKPGGSD